jgi:hypothetical protein
VSKRVRLAIVVLTLLVTSAAWMFRARLGKPGNAKSQNTVKKKEAVQRQSPRDPCWFKSLNLEDESITYLDIKERDDRELHGYPKEIPLSEAIRIFNEEKDCYDWMAPYPPLTEDELIAAIVAGPGCVIPEESLRIQKDALWKIATRRMMPKGSLLVWWTGSLVQESPLRPYGTIKAEGLSIAIHLGLENWEPGTMFKPEQVFVIRNTYYKVVITH